MKKVVQVQVSTGIHGHMKKAMDQIEQDVKLVDIIIEILDARIKVKKKNK